MLHDKDLPIMIWVEACNTIVYVQNMILQSLLEENTLKEAFIGVKHEIGNLRIFSCPVYIHVPKEKRMNMEPSIRIGIFVGYKETSKSYHIYIPGHRYVVVRWDVRFVE
jgi:hypothetical protein